MLGGVAPFATLTWWTSADLAFGGVAEWRLTEDTSINIAAELEDLGYTALWSSGGFNPGLSPHFERLLASTTHLAVASGIVSIWSSPSYQIAEGVADLEAIYPGRFVLGVGASHVPLAESYARPYSHMVEYLDALDAATPPVMKDRRVLAALGPRMLQLARDRVAGAHPYLVPVEHTARAREILGTTPLLAPEVAVVLEKDASAARQVARSFTEGYLGLPNYTNNLRSFGFGEDDLVGAGSDRLIDALVCWGSPDAVATQIRRHYEAGADHVCVQVLSTRESFPLEEYRELAPALLSA